METSGAEWHENRLPSLMRSLELLDEKELDVDDDNTYYDALGTVLEELDEANVTYNNDTTPAFLLSAQHRILLSLGHGDTNDRSRAHSLSLLCTELQSSRALAAIRAPTNTSDPIAAADARLAHSLSRTCAALRVSSRDATDPAGIAALLRSLSSRAHASAKAAGVSLLGPITVDDTQRARLEEASILLGNEYAQRRAQIAERLHTTARAFCDGARNAPSADARSAAAVANAMARTPPPPQFALAHAIAARSWLAAPRAVSSTESGKAGVAVKRTLMGAVPDRGGRVGAAAAKANDRPAKDKAGKQRKNRKGGKSRRVKGQ